MERFPDAADPALLFAFYAAAAGRPEDARRAADQMLRIDPDNRQVRSVIERLDATERPRR
jgi:cytochrome c-type biogenesis protein CcmH/NrfG